MPMQPCGALPTYSERKAEIRPETGIGEPSQKPPTYSPAAGAVVALKLVLAHPGPWGGRAWPRVASRPHRPGSRPGAASPPGGAGKAPRRLLQRPLPLPLHIPIQCLPYDRPLGGLVIGGEVGRGGGGGGGAGAGGPGAGVGLVLRRDGGKARGQGLIPAGGRCCVAGWRLEGGEGRGLRSVAGARVSDGRGGPGQA